MAAIVVIFLDGLTEKIATKKMWLYRRLEKIPWANYVSNLHILRKHVNEKHN